MADRGPNYDVERRRLMMQAEEHEDTIERGHSRLAEIERAKKRNFARAELANLELDVEAEAIRENEASLAARITEIQANLKAMAVKTGVSSG